MLCPLMSLISAYVSERKKEFQRERKRLCVCDCVCVCRIFTEKNGLLRYEGKKDMEDIEKTRT